ncbi:MAG TPA: hypothetical protein VKZ60_09375, partial [Chloroflexota bacterium]|nr:hypothetical protein [Chloroflexota bacterium]
MEAQAELTKAKARVAVGSRWVVPAAVLGLLVVAPFALPTYWLKLLTEVLILGIFAMSLDLILGYTGLVSFGHAAFFGLGAYTTGILSVRLTNHAGVTLPAALVVAGVAALVIGYLS